MDVKDTTANATTIGGIFMYLMQFQAEITIMVLLTGLFLNITRIVDWIQSKRKNDGKN